MDSFFTSSIFVWKDVIYSLYILVLRWFPYLFFNTFRIFVLAFRSLSFFYLFPILHCFLFNYILILHFFISRFSLFFNFLCSNYLHPLVIYFTLFISLFPIFIFGFSLFVLNLLCSNYSHPLVIYLFSVFNYFFNYYVRIIYFLSVIYEQLLFISFRIFWIVEFFH